MRSVYLNTETGVDRRTFLRGMLATVPVIAAPAAVLEALEPKRTIFLPPKQGWLVGVDPGGKDATTFVARYVHKQYSLNYIVTREELSEESLDAMLAEMREHTTRAILESMQRTKERIAANILGRAFGKTSLNTDVFRV